MRDLCSVACQTRSLDDYRRPWRLAALSRPLRGLGPHQRVWRSWECDLESVAEAVVARLLQSGLAASAEAAAAPVVAAAEAERPAAVKTEADWEEELGVPRDYGI